MYIHAQCVWCITGMIREEKKYNKRMRRTMRKESEKEEKREKEKGWMRNKSLWMKGYDIVSLSVHLHSCISLRKPFHKKCVKCRTCCKSLTPATLNEHQTQLYCNVR